MPFFFIPREIAVERLVVNITGNPVRKTFQGREYLVASATLIVPGVLNGSQGPLYYPADEVSKSPSRWDTIPILVYHPTENDSGRSLKVLDRQGIGHIANSRFENGKLQSDLWFDAERTQSVDPRVYNAVLNSKAIELSTGLGTENEDAEDGANFNGTEYKATARNYQPDHLAILPDQVGACSLSDGCGVNNALVGLQGSLQSALMERMGSDPWITAVESTYLVFRTSEGLFKLGYSTPNDTVALSDGEPVAVQSKTIYAATNKESDMADNKMKSEDRKKIVDGLITNSCCWTEDDRTELEGMSDIALQRTKDSADHQVENEELLVAAEKGFNSDREAITFNREKREWEQTQKKPVDNEGRDKDKSLVLSDEDRAVLNYGREAMQKDRKLLIDRITQNVSDDAKPDKVALLQKKSIEDLREIADLMPEPKPTRNYYAGQPQEQTDQPLDQDDMLEEPEMDWVANSAFAKS